MLRIRLRRTGKRNQPSYRIVIVEHTAPVQGSYLEAVGHFNPRASQLTVNQERVTFWMDRGAQPSERIAKLLTNLGMKHGLLALPDFSRKPQRTKKRPAAEPAATPTPPTPSETVSADTEPKTETTTEPIAVTEETPAEISQDDTSPTEGGSNSQSDTEEVANQE